jgi:hypothetical protein
LNKIRPGLAKKGIVEQSTHFMFLGKDVATFSDQIAIIHPFETGFPFSVKGEEFYKLISGITEDELELSIKDDKLSIQSKSTKAGMSTIVDDKDRVDRLVTTLKKEMKDWVAIPKDLLSGLYLAMFSAAKDLSQGTLSCISVSGKDICSSDSLRASWYEMEKEVASFLIPAKDVNELVKFTDVESICQSENWVHFKTKGGVTFSVRKILGVFKDLKKKFDIEGDTITLPPSLKEVTDSIIFLSEGNIEVNKIISVGIESNKITLKAEKETGWVEKTVEFKYKGKPAKFLINPIFLSQILTKATEMILTERIALFLTDGFAHIIALPIEE